MVDGASKLSLSNGTIKRGKRIIMKTIKMKRRYSAMVVAGVMGVTLLGAGAKVYASPAYIVSLDVNPGVEMEVNMFDRVIGVETNEDAAAVLEGVNLQNMPVEEAISTAVESIAEAGYLGDNSGEIYITATSETDEAAAGDIATELGTATQEQLAEDGIEAEVTAQGIGYQMVQAARNLSAELKCTITPGKYNIMTHLLGKTDEEITNEGLATMKVKELMDQRKEMKTADNQEAVETTDETTSTDEVTEETAADSTAVNKGQAKAAVKAEQAAAKSENKSIKAESKVKSNANGNAAKANKQAE